MNKYSNLPFSIGEQYENWEFELEILPERIKGYDSYLYVGNNFNLKKSKDKYELLFSLDVLVAVIIFFEREKNTSKIKLSFLIDTCYRTLLLNNRIILIYGKPCLVDRICRLV
jgi:hypothetical protein